MSTQVKYLNGMALLPVPDSRMKDSYDFKDGTTTGEEAGGFSPASAAKSIGLLILPKKACSLIKKTEKMRVFELSLIHIFKKRAGLSPGAYRRSAV